jgi:hypothetical protein
LVSHFSDFSTIFYAIYKNQGNHFTIGVTLLKGRPRKESFSCNVVPGARAAAVRRKIRPGIAGVRPGKGRGGSYGPLGVDLGPAGGAPRLPAAAAAGAAAPARGGGPAAHRGAE